MTPVNDLVVNMPVINQKSFKQVCFRFKRITIKYSRNMEYAAHPRYISKKLI
jgi:hypothetical protein